jgi:hypothetical protein
MPLNHFAIATNSVVIRGYVLPLFLLLEIPSAHFWHWHYQPFLMLL